VSGDASPMLELRGHHGRLRSLHRALGTWASGVAAGEAGGGGGTERGRQDDAAARHLRRHRAAQRRALVSRGTALGRTARRHEIVAHGIRARGRKARRLFPGP